MAVILYVASYKGGSDSSGVRVGHGWATAQGAGYKGAGFELQLGGVVDCTGWDWPRTLDVAAL